VMGRRRDRKRRDGRIRDRKGQARGRWDRKRQKKTQLEMYNVVSL
jgi:hypothetical protein